MANQSSRRRRTPVQERSRETVEAICAAASSLIAEGGIGSLTTNAVASRAGVSITAVYAYFPDKWAIVHELFRRFEELRAAALGDLYREFETADHWPAVIDRIWDTMSRFRAEMPGVMALRHAMHSQPGLAELDRAGSVRAASGFADAMRVRRPTLHPDDAFRASWAVTLAAGTLIDDAVRDGSVSRERLEEGCRLIKGHLATYLEGES